MHKDSQPIKIVAGMQQCFCQHATKLRFCAIVSRQIFWMIECKIFLHRLYSPITWFHERYGLHKENK